VSYLPKVANFNLPHLYLAPPPLWVIPFKFREYVKRQKTKVPGLSCGIACMILRLAILTQYRHVTDQGQADI